MNGNTDNKRLSLGIIKELGELPTGAVISEQGLAKMFDLDVTHRNARQ